MNELVHADVFFLIASVAVIIVAAAIVTAGIYIIRILRNVDDISQTVRVESHNIAHDLSDLRSDLKENIRRQKIFTGLVGFFSGLIAKTKRRRSKKK